MAIGKGSLIRAANAAASEKKTEKAQVTYTWKVPASQLKDIPAEWRGPKYVKPNVSMLAESISRCGILEPVPVVLTGKNTYQVVGGTKRMEVVRMLGIEEVPVTVLPGISMEDAEALYKELAPFSDAAQDTVHNAKFRTTALFGSRRIPEYLL